MSSCLFRGKPRLSEYIIHPNINFVNLVEFREIKYFRFQIIIVELHKYRQVSGMNLKDASIKRIEEICKERGSNICDLALKGGMSPSAIYDLVKGRTKCSKIVTIKRFCEGAEITLAEFFDREYFNDPEGD